MKHYGDLLSRLRSATRLPMLQALCNEVADAIEELMGAENAKTAKSAPTSDYISREAALIANCYFCSAHLKDDSPCDEKCADYMKFMEIPAADVRPVVRGKWKPSMCGTAHGPIQDKDEWYGPLFLCSECGADMIGASNFCPNCGADMRPQSPKEDEP